MADGARLSAAETAARLGVKLPTLYAYVSRGLLHRERGPAGSTFDPLEVERFAIGRRRGRAGGSDRPPVLVRDGRPTGGPLMTIDTDVALIEDGELYYRGRPAAELAVQARFETVCRWLWTGEEDPDVRFTPVADTLAAVRAVLDAAPPAVGPIARMQLALPMMAALDPMREVLDRSAVARRAGTMIVTLAAAVGDQPDAAEVAELDGDIAGRLAAALCGDRAADPAVTDVLNAALVLLVDHDLAVSTLAARAAASARANPYAVVISGLGALDSPLHGSASGAAYRMLAAVGDGEPARAVISRVLAAGRGGVPGFGHRIYTDADPRAELIMELISERLAHRNQTAAAIAAAGEIAALVGDAGFRNVDLALAVLSLAAGMPADAGEVIFAVARTGGWITHAIDEYAQAPLRLRPVGRYVGP